MARASEAAPGTASIVARPSRFRWTDGTGWTNRRQRQALDAPISIYEVHAGSWLRDRRRGNRSLNWSELAERLVPYVADLGFTHIELMPIMPSIRSAAPGAISRSAFRADGRYGTPEDFAHFVDRCHRAGIGVILDWVPAHFPTDVCMASPSSTAPRSTSMRIRAKAFTSDWNTLIYNLGRSEVQGFLIASALDWLEHFHVDGSSRRCRRLDALPRLFAAAGRMDPQPLWRARKSRIRRLLQAPQQHRRASAPGVMTIAEESTAWPGVTAPREWRPRLLLKWNMGWMHDTLTYMEQDPIYRTLHHNAMTFGMVYAYSEHFVLPLSHDEVVHGKGSLFGKMPGDTWQKLANLRAYFGFMWTFPGKKLLFMGGEIGQASEWNHERRSRGAAEGSRPCGPAEAGRRPQPALPREPALHATDNDPTVFRWMVADDAATACSPGCATATTARCRLQHDAGGAHGLPNRRAARRTLAERLNSDAASMAAAMSAMAVRSRRGRSRRAGRDCPRS